MRGSHDDVGMKTKREKKKKWGVGGREGSTLPHPSTAKDEVNVTDDRISLMELKLKLSRTLQQTDLGLAFLGDGGEGEKKKCVEQTVMAMAAYAVDA